MTKKGAFEKEFDSFAIGFDDANEETVKATAIITWGAIIKVSPVDEGRFRGNWFATTSKPSSRVTDKTDTSKDGQETALVAANRVDRAKDWSSFYLTNNLPYAIPLEFGLYNDGPKTEGGYSSQAVGGMVRVNMAKSKKLLEDEANKRYKKL